jgi:signal transduction histidine kinase
MRLLNKTIRSYLFYSFTIILVAIPLFYFVVKKVLLHSVDHSLRTQMHDIRFNLPSIHSAEELQTWSKMDKDIRLTETNEELPDRIYTIYHPNPRHRDDDPYREIAGTIKVNGHLYALIISNSLVENDDLLGSILLVQFFLLIFLMGGMLWINRSISQKIWKPFYAGLDTMKKYELANHEPVQLEKTDIDEFAELNRAIKQFTDRNHEIYVRQKEFTENAAHELQTPLAIFQGKIDLLMQTEPLSEEQATLIGALDNANLRLSRLNKSLLLLSKIENNQFSQTEPIEITSLLPGITETLLVNAGFDRAKVEERYQNGILINANRTLIEMLAGNLLLNAIRHNVEDGRIKIETLERSLIISNSGNEEPLDSDKIFQRFYKSAKHPASTGLGLAIVKEICGLYHYQLSYQFQPGWHQFEVVFSG